MITDEIRHKISNIRIPIVIISYNNYKYVENTIQQFIGINPDLLETIVIMDNNSNDANTQLYLQKRQTEVVVIFNQDNVGPWVSTSCNAHVYHALPEQYILTDPDLEFNKNLPKNFIDIFCEIMSKYDMEKIGFAIEIDDCDKFYKYPDYNQERSILEWESGFWKPEEMTTYTTNDGTMELTLHHCCIDTTFAMYNKKFMNIAGWWAYKGIRVSGNFKCRHLPFYIEDPILSMHDKLVHYEHSKFSTTSNCAMRYITENFYIVNKCDERILIEKDDYNLFFWKTMYDDYEPKIFEIIDKFSKKETNTIILGDCIGEKTIYASRKSKHVYVMRCDVSTNSEFEKIVKNNCKNVSLVGSDTLLETLDKINMDDVKLIIVDAHGKEEQIMNRLIKYKEEYGITICIKLYLTEWKNATYKKMFNTMNLIKIQNKESFCVW